MHDLKWCTFTFCDKNNPTVLFAIGDYGITPCVAMATNVRCIKMVMLGKKKSIEPVCCLSASFNMFIIL